MPYVSHPVRRIRDDPVANDTVTLRVTAVDGAARDTLARTLAEIGTVEDRLRFAALTVTVPQPAVGTVCELEGVTAVETANTLTMDADGAGEDVDPAR